MTHLCVEQVVVFRFPIERSHSHESSLLIDEESAALVPVHDGEGKRRAVVRGVLIAHSELKNTRTFWPILL